MKVMFNRKLRREAWGGGAHALSSLFDHLVKRGFSVVTSLDHNDIDVIVMFDPRPEAGGYSAQDLLKYKLQHPHVKILHRVNECDARKNTSCMDTMLIQANAIADETVFISKWLCDHLSQKAVFQGKNHVIINGCNQDWFFPTGAWSLNSPVRVVTHHWSDHEMKGLDVYETLNDLADHGACEFTYIGRVKSTFKPKSSRTHIIPPMYGQELGKELRRHDIYVTGSRFEPCGMHHIEAASSGLPVIYHIDGGAIPEVCSSHGIPISNATHEHVALALLLAQEDYGVLRWSINYGNLSSERCNLAYEEVIRGMVS